MDFCIEPFLGERSTLLPLFSEADDSPDQVAGYIELGEVLVANRAGRIIGHIQLIRHSSDWEIKSLAVVSSERGRGIGSALIGAALEACAGTTRVRVATASADLDNLRFYQRRGFRMESIERDAFTPEHGYPVMEIDGIPLRDRVWLSLDVDSHGARVTPAVVRRR